MGDAGICWDGGKFDAYCQKWHEEKNYTTLAVAGNHENYDIIKKLPIVEKWGGKVYQVSPHIFYTVSGELYNICGYNCLVINGADSHDKERRKEGRDWWKDERISEEDLKNAYKNLEKVDFKVDFIFSHTGGTEVCRNFGFKPTPSDLLLDKILNNITYQYHYCGHIHKDVKINEKTRVLYLDIIEIEVEKGGFISRLGNRNSRDS